MNTSSGKAPRPIQFSRRSTTTTRVIALIGCCLIISAVVVVSSRANSALRSGERLHKHNPFFNPKAVAPGITVDQVVSLKEVPVPVPMAAIIVGPIPGPGTDLNFQPLTTDIVKSQPELVKLGKALFWDMQVGSDGIQACATCHFNAGADIRAKNQISPNLSDTNFTLNNAPNGDAFGGDNTWGDATVPYTANDPLTPNPPGPSPLPPAALNVPGFPQFGPNYEVTSADFPLNDWFRPTELTPRGPGVTIFDEFANVSRDTNDILASQGVRLNLFCGLPPACSSTLPACVGATSPGSPVECSTPEPDIFNTVAPGTLQVDGRVRREMPRNAPTMINAVFNFDNLWDGKASFIFNGVNPFGFRDRTHKLQEIINGTVTPVFVRITNSSLASVAAGVPVAPNNIAMAFDKRTFPDVGRKMVSLRPLAKQYVHPQDSVLGKLSRAVLNPDGTLSGPKGLTVATYEDMVKLAFRSQWWSSPALFGGYTQMQTNFSLFFGLAVQAYEATLVSDNTPFDHFMGAPHPVRQNHGNPIPPNPKALTERQRLGLSLFEDDDPNLGTHCADCHVPPVTTGHTVIDYQPDAQGVPSLAAGEAIEFMIMGDNEEEANYDHGMYNIGVRRSCITGIDPSTCPSHTEDRGRGATATKNNAAFANPLTGTTVGISAISRTASVVTVTTIADNPLAAGQVVTIFGVSDTKYNGTFAVVAVNSQTQFTYAQPNLPDSSSSGGSATGPNAPFPLSLVELTALRESSACNGYPMFQAGSGCLPPDVARFIPDVPMLPRRVTNGAFKAPNLRNIKFSGPYFHIGDSATLRQVVEFYTRGGNFPNTNLHDKTVDVEGIPPLAFPEFNPVAEANIEALVDFLAEGLKDDRVAFEKGPFDHPELRVPNGSPNGDSSKDLFIEIPAVGRLGRATELPTFLGLDPQQP
jgi:cytochrome c peroxidase